MDQKQLAQVSLSIALGKCLKYRSGLVVSVFLTIDFYVYDVYVLLLLRISTITAYMLVAVISLFLCKLQWDLVSIMCSIMQSVVFMTKVAKFGSKFYCIK